MEPFLQAETLVIELLLVVSLVAIVVRRRNIPYTVALVVAGLLITSQSPLSFDLTPELILALFVPPLVFEAALHLNLVELRRNLASILLLAVPGVVASTLIVGFVVAAGGQLSLPLALVFGALMAATDPVAVVALFRTLRVPPRLALLVEGESLLNDGTAIVIFQLALAAALTGHFNWVEGLGEFARVAVGGTVVGLVLGWATARLISHLDDYLIETTLTTILAFGAYLLAERLHFSGVLAVVAAGLVNGNLGAQGMSPTTRIVLFNFWEYVAFLANSLVFLLIGLQIDVPLLLADWPAIAWALVAVLLARVVVVYSLSNLVNRWVEPVPLAWQHVLTWGGLRGAISLALALTLPAALGAQRDLVRVMAFGVVLFTLLAQATTMPALIRRLRIVTRSAAQIEYELRRARLAALRAADAHLDRLHGAGLLSSPTWEQLKRDSAVRIAAAAEAVWSVLQAEPALDIEERALGRREWLRSQRGALLDLRRDGAVSDEVFERLAAELDTGLQDAPVSAPEAETEPDAAEESSGTGANDAQA